MARVLIAEDDSALRLILQKNLTKKGYEPVLCADGLAAWQLLERDSGFDIIITDMMMPKMDGRELIQKIRTSAECSHIPIIVMSGVVTTKEIADLLDTGASAFIAKPIKASDLQSEIEEVMGLPEWGVSLKATQK